MEKVGLSRSSSMSHWEPCPGLKLNSCLKPVKHKAPFQMERVLYTNFQVHILDCTIELLKNNC
jgi:hypothetical protein